MNNQLTWEQNVRVEALNAAIRQYTGVEFDGIEVTLEAAEQFEKYIFGTVETPQEVLPVQIFQPPAEAPHNNRNPADLTGFIIQLPGQERHTHLPVQHRDRKPPWCNTCGLTSTLRTPKVAFPSTRTGMEDKKESTDDN